MHRPTTLALSRPTLVVVAAATCAAVVRLLLLRAPLSSDEAGFLIVAHQWGHGRSLYGNYWVDRPPGLIALFAVAAAGGGAIALRLLGVVAAVTSIVLGARIAGVVAPGRPVAVPGTAVVVAALVSSRLLDVALVNGEILALPFLMLGLLAALRAATAETGPGRGRWAVLAGGSGVAALSVKQNLADVVVVVAALTLALVVRRRGRAAVVLLAGALAGGTVVGAAVLGLAWLHGTTPAGLWDAVVVFRLRAADVLATPTHAAAGRARLLGLAVLLSGAPLVLVRLPRLVRRPGHAPGSPSGLHQDDPLLGWVAITLLAWEGFSVAMGGSFWLHYLVGLVPGLALVFALTLGRPPLRPRVGALRSPWLVPGVLAASCAVGLVGFTVSPPRTPSDEQAVVTYLRRHADAGRTAVVAFGRPSILLAAGMRSPYPLLWSLPVRVRDPHLRRLTPVLRHRRAEWVVTNPVALASWGFGATRAERVLTRNYRLAYRAGELQVWRAARPGRSWHLPAP